MGGRDYRKVLTKALENYMKYPGVEFPIEFAGTGIVAGGLRHILHDGVALEEKETRPQGRNAAL